MAEAKFNIWITIRKAFEAAVLFVLTILATNPEFLLNLLGEWQNVTIGAGVMALLRAAYNWWKHRN